MIKFLIAIISIALGSFAQYLLKIGMDSLQVNNSNVKAILSGGITSVPLWGGIICYGLSLVFWLYVLSQMELSKAYPLVSLGYVFTLFLGYWLLHEPINMNKLVGVLLIISGVIFITRS